MKGFFLFFENFNRDFGTLGIKIVKIWFQIRTRRPRIRVHANFGKFGCIISLKNNQLACFFGHPVDWSKMRKKVPTNVNCVLIANL